MSNVFLTGLKLPWVYEAVLSIIDVAPGGSSKKTNESKARRDAINQYVAEVETLWIQAFGKEHVCERKTIARKLRAALQIYFNKVSCSKVECYSKREIFKQWKESVDANTLFDLLKSTSDPNTLGESELIFYNAQKSGREGHVTNELDPEYQEEETTEQPMEIVDDEVAEANGAEEGDDDRDTDYIFLEDDSFMENKIDIDVRRTRSGSTIISPVQVSSPPIPYPKPRIRKKRNCTDAIKAAISKVSFECGISVEKSRKAVKIISKELYNHDYYLSLDEKTSSLNPGTKRTRLATDKKTKISDIDYNEYDDIIPSAKSIRNYKSLQATQEEVKAAVALYRKKADDNVTFHFDTTSRNCIDGEWPALILNFSKGERFNLRPVFFAYEDRENIARLITETYERLAIAAELKLSEPVSGKTLWENTDNLMTDSVSKNLKIDVLIASKLGSSHLPNSLLCNAHVVEMFDKTNLKVLADIERKLKLRERLEKINPSLRTFYRGKAAIVVAGIYALLKLITHDKSGNTVSLAEEFDDLLENEGIAKHMVLYHERRFTVLGYCAASILCALPELRRLLADTNRTNLLVEACKIYVECELFLAELHVLAVFTQRVTLPFLNCLEKTEQKDLLQIFPQLYEDLLMHRMDTLKEYFVSYHHVEVAEITDESEKVMLNRMCEEAAKGFDVQRGSEYGFGINHADRGTTKLHALSESQVEAIDVVHNLPCERLLATFGHRSVVAKYRNKSFTAQGIRDDLVLFNSDQATVESTTRKISKILKEKELDWTQQQKELRSQRIKKKIADLQTGLNYIKKLLQSCKSWGGPATTPNELEDLLTKRSDISEKIVTTELKYYCKTHECERKANPDLFKIMIPRDQQLENLLILLGGNNHVATLDASSVLDLPTMKELEVELGTVDIAMKDNNKRDRIDGMCIVVWLDEKTNKPMWYLGFVKSMKEEKYEVEHLIRTNSNNFWKNPAVPREHTFDVEDEQFLDVKINGEWEVESISGNRINMRYHLKNSQEIDNVFKKMEG